MALALALALTGAGAEAADKHPFKVGLVTQVVRTGFTLQPLEGAGRLVFRPAQSNYAGVTLGYRWLAGTLSFAVPASSEIRAVEGTSQYRDYRLGLYFRRFGVEGSYNRFLGYLIDNSSELSAATLGGATYYRVADMESLGYGLNFFWVPSGESRYSLAAALDQSEIQEKSGGAWVLLASWRRQVITSASPWIPAEKQAEYGEDRLIQRADMDSYGVGAGYAYHWVPAGGFFASPMLAVTVGAQRFRYDRGAGLETVAKASANLHARLALGYNGHRFFSFVSVYSDLFSQVSRSLRLGADIQGFAFALGFRF